MHDTPVVPSRAVGVGTIVAACLVATVVTVSAAPDLRPKESPKAPLTMELVPTAIVLDRADTADVLVLIANSGTTPLRRVTLRLHVPADVTNVEERWDSGPPRKAGSAAYTLQDVAALEQRLVRIALVHRGGWTTVKSTALVVQAEYAWETPTLKATIAGEVLRPLSVKIGALEALSVLGIPLSLAIFVVPGLLGLSLFTAVLREPIKWIDDNRLFVSFLGSVLLILLWGRFLRGLLNGPDLWSGVSIELLLAFTVVAGLLGGLAGTVVRRFQRTAAERWPVTQAQNLMSLLANLAERGMLPASSSIVQLADGSEFSAVAAETDAPNEIVLLPRRYRITTTDARVRQRFTDAVADGASSAALARLLRRNSSVVRVADGIKRRNDAAGQFAAVPNETQPRWIPREGITRTAQPGSLWII